MNKQWVTDNEDVCYKLINFTLTIGDNEPFKMKRLASTAQELMDFAKLDGCCDDLTLDNIELAYYRMQIFLYATVDYKHKNVSKYKQLDYYDALIEANNAITGEQPYNYIFDLGYNVSKEVKLADDYVEIKLPNEWFVVIPATSYEVLDILDAHRREGCLHQLIYNALIKTLPITIK